MEVFKEFIVEHMGVLFGKKLKTNKMKNEFVTYKQALALKELGFNEKCLAYWFNETPLNPEGQCLVYYRKPYDNVGITNGIIREYGWAPIYQQAFRWFRENHGLYTEIFVDDDRTFGFLISYFIDKDYYDERVDKPIQRKYSTHEEAESACLDKLIEICKTKTNEK